MMAPMSSRGVNQARERHVRLRDAAALANAKELADLEPPAAWANIVGVTGSPFDAYLTLRGAGGRPRRLRSRGSALAFPRGSSARVPA
jgi:hypothetical protein